MQYIRKSGHFHQPVKKRLYSCSTFSAASYCSLECFCESLSRRYKGSFCSLKTQNNILENHTTHKHSNTTPVNTFYLDGFKEI